MWRRPYVPSESSSQPKVMAVGIAPGETEEQIGKPFSGSVGSVVREALSGMVGGDVYYTNLVKRRPINDDGKARKPSSREASYCSRHLYEEMMSFKVPLVVTFGQLPTAYVMGDSEVQMEHVHGLAIQLERFGYTFILLPMYDPGHVARSGGLTGPTGTVWLDDLQELRNLVDGL